MKRKLMLLNLVLALLIAGAGWRLRQEWLAEDARAKSVLSQTPKTPPAPVVVPMPKPQPVTSASYGEVAQKMLFAKDRNPNIIIEQKAPEPPKPMPPLPVLHGVMNLPSGPTAVMSEQNNPRHVGVRAGDKIGDFKVVAVNTDKITFEWDGKTIVKEARDLVQTAAAPPPGATNAPAMAAAGAPAASAAPPKPVAEIPKEATPTDDGGYRYTDPQGKKWLMRQTPFGIAKVEDKSPK